jgi:lipoprotein signal peptidase
VKSVLTPHMETKYIQQLYRSISLLLFLYDKWVSIPSNTTMFDFILLSTPATCFGLLSGHHQALGYTIQLYIYLLLLLMAIH